MDRKDFLTAKKKRTAFQRQTTTSQVFRTYSGINEYTGAWTKNEVQHLLKRTMFGSTKADIDHFLVMTMTQAVDELMNPTAPLPSPPVNDYSPGTTDSSVPAGTTWVNSPTTDGTLNSQRRGSFKKWWTGVMINQDRSIREKMTLFWANHFGTETAEIGNAHYVYRHHNLLRQSALGNFRQLIKDVTIDTGMLLYLNGYLNTASAPDENYGRELQELFTIGKDPITNLAAFSEDDVKKAAKVLTGWRINNSTFVSYFDGARHDATNKQFSSFYNGTTITGQSGANGASETDLLINMLFAKNEVSRFIVRKLYRWFVYYNIDAATETNVIEPLAAIFRNNNYSIQPVLSALFKSEHFFDVLNQGCFIKSPVDHVISCLREFNVVFPNSTTEYAEVYAMWNYIFNWMTTMNQNIGDPPNVSGWPSYYQAPQFHELWINSDTLPKRNKFTDTMILTGFTRMGKKIIVNCVAFTAALPNPSDPNALIDDALAILYRIQLSPTTKQTIKVQILLSNQTSDYYWSNAWNAYIADTSNVSNFNVVNNRLKGFYQYLMNLSEYQLS